MGPADRTPLGVATGSGPIEHLLRRWPCSLQTVCAWHLVTERLGAEPGFLERLQFPRAGRCREAVQPDLRGGSGAELRARSMKPLKRFCPALLGLVLLLTAWRLLTSA